MASIKFDSDSDVIKAIAADFNNRAGETFFWPGFTSGTSVSMSAINKGCDHTAAAWFRLDGTIQVFKSKHSPFGRSSFNPICFNLHDPNGLDDLYACLIEVILPKVTDVEQQ